jgi:transposase
MTTPCITPGTLDEATALIANQQSEIQHLKHELAQLKRMIFGQKTEKFAPKTDDAQQMVLKGLFDTPQSSTPGFAETREKISYERRKPGHGRKPIPDDLHREIHLLDVPESEKICSCCDTQKKHIGDDITEELEYKPAVLFVNRYVRPKYACPNCPDTGITSALLPSRPIDKGIAGAGLISYIITSKYVDHLPLYRLEQMFKRYAIDVSRSTMTGWIAKVCVDLAGVYHEMHRMLKISFVIQGDETPLKVMDDTVVDKNYLLGYLWPFVGDGRIAVFDYRDSRNKDGPVQFLDGFTGYLQTDGYTGYNAAVGKYGLRHQMCWAHARRKFFEAKDLDSEFVEQVLSRIGKLYEIEKRAREHTPEKMTPQERHELRQAECPALLAALKQLLENPGKIFLPKNDICNAIAYTLDHWKELTRFLDDGRLDIDNNRCENIIRPVAIGKKNWLFAGSPEGAKRMAIIYSLVATCKLNSINPYEYLRDILPITASYPSKKIADLVPTNWKMSKSI